jgi:hypothetical protein
MGGYLRFLCLALALACGGCGDEFTSASSSSSDGGATTGDTGVLTECPTTPSAGTFCVDVSAEGRVPAYGDAVASAMQLDGKGTVFVYLYDKDPGVELGVAPAAVLQYPKTIGEEITTSNLPVTVSGTATAGTYWFAVAFHDTPASARKTATSTVGGDFVNQPSVDAQKRLQYPKVTLTSGSSERVPVRIKPVRRIDAVVRSALDTVTAQKPTTNGNGPMLLILFEGDFAQTNIFNGLAIEDCIDVKPKVLPPTRVGVQIPTVATGSQKIMGLLYDWKTPGPGESNILTGGTLVTQTSGVSVNIDEDKWLATADIPLTQVVPFSTPPPASDPLVCR